MNTFLLFRQYARRKQIPASQKHVYCKEERISVTEFLCQDNDVHGKAMTEVEQLI